MTERPPILDWRRSILAAAVLALLLFGLFYALAAHGAPAAHAQGTLSLEIKKTLQGSNSFKSNWRQIKRCPPSTGKIAPVT